MPVVDSGLKRKRDFDKRPQPLRRRPVLRSAIATTTRAARRGPTSPGVSGRFNTRDLLESMVLPSKVISDQYAAVVDRSRPTARSSPVA